jgi:hypothetical protein
VGVAAPGESERIRRVGASEIVAGSADDLPVVLRVPGIGPGRILGGPVTVVGELLQILLPEYAHGELPF